MTVTEEAMEVEALDHFAQLKKIESELTPDVQTLLQNEDDKISLDVTKVDLVRLQRFFTYGMKNLTFANCDIKFTFDDAQYIIALIKAGKAHIVLGEIKAAAGHSFEFTRKGLLYALALCTRYRYRDLAGLEKDESSAEEKQCAKYLREMHLSAIALILQLCTTSDALLLYIGYCQNVANNEIKFVAVPRAVLNKPGTENAAQKLTSFWDRPLKKAVANWYFQRTADELAEMELRKSSEHLQWTNRDVFAVCHPKHQKNIYHDGPAKRVIESLYQVIVNGYPKEKMAGKNRSDYAYLHPNPMDRYSDEQIKFEDEYKPLDKFGAIQEARYLDDEPMIEKVKEQELSRELLPEKWSRNVEVQRAALPYSSLLSTIRSLGKLAAIGALDEETTKLVIERLENGELLEKEQINPIDAVIAKAAYDFGSDPKRKLKWDNNEKVSNALAKFCEKTVANWNATTGKRICLAFGSIGDTECSVPGTKLNPLEAAAALSALFCRNQQVTSLVSSADTVRELELAQPVTLDQFKTSLLKNGSQTPSTGLPALEWAASNKKSFDAFVLFTTTSQLKEGFDVKAVEALRNYQSASGIGNARLVVVQLDGKTTSTDSNEYLHVLGLNNMTPRVITDYISAKI